MNILCKLFLLLTVITSAFCLRSEEIEKALSVLGFEDWEEPTKMEIAKAYEYLKTNTKEAQALKQINAAYEILRKNKGQQKHHQRFAQTQQSTFTRKDFEDIFDGFNIFGDNEFIVIEDEKFEEQPKKKTELNVKSFLGWCQTNWQIIFAAMLISYGIVTIWKK